MISHKAYKINIQIPQDYIRPQTRRPSQSVVQLCKVRHKVAARVFRIASTYDYMGVRRKFLGNKSHTHKGSVCPWEQFLTKCKQPVYSLCAAASAVKLMASVLVEDDTNTWMREKALAAEFMISLMCWMPVVNCKM